MGLGCLDMEQRTYQYHQLHNNPDSKVYGANMVPIWDPQDPGGPHELCYLGRHHDVCIHEE